MVAHPNYSTLVSRPNRCVGFYKCVASLFNVRDSLFSNGEPLSSANSSLLIGFTKPPEVRTVGAPKISSLIQPMLCDVMCPVSSLALPAYPSPMLPALPGLHEQLLLLVLQKKVSPLCLIKCFCTACIAAESLWHFQLLELLYFSIHS